MNCYNLLFYLFKTYTLYNNLYYNYNFYILSLFLNPCITYFLKQRGKRPNTIIYVFDKTINNKNENENENVKNNQNLLTDKQQEDYFKIEILDDEKEKDENIEIELDNFTVIEKFEK